MRTSQPLDTRQPPEGWAPVVSSLLPALADRVAGWAVLKNHEPLPAVSGDIDTCLVRARWDDFLRALADELRPWGGHTIVACDHYLGVRLVFVASTVPGDRSGACLEVDLADGVWWKGRRLAPASAILAAAVKDPRGFLRASAGWEAAVLLTLSALDRTGRLREEVVASRRIREKASEDPVGFVAAMTTFHGRAGAVGAERFLDDRWIAGAGLAVIRHRMGSDPFAWGSRPAAFARRKAMSHWRGLPRTVGDDPEPWLARVGRGHLCLEVPR